MVLAQSMLLASRSVPSVTPVHQRLQVRVEQRDYAGAAESMEDC